MVVRFWVLAVTLVVAGCAGKPERMAVEPRPVAAVAPQPPALTPINAGLSPAAALWHLRAGLNVAALACRGPEAEAIVSGYNALLAGHGPTLRAAEATYAAEYQAQGGDWRDRYDDAQTRLYNFWSQARGRAGLCEAAGAALAVTQGADDAALAGLAAKQLAALDRPFAPPRLEVDARVFSAPAMVMVASR